MPRHQRPGRVVREPIQVYLTAEERRELDRLAEEHGLSRAEVLRRGIQSFARERAERRSPMLDLVEELAAMPVPEGYRPNTAEHVDDHLVESYLDTHEDEGPPR
jgi:hypothetical protein